MNFIEPKSNEDVTAPLLENVSNDRKEDLANFSIIIVGIITFVGDSTRGILNPVLWPLCKVKFQPISLYLPC
jgi:hypothetical protein